MADRTNLPVAARLYVTLVCGAGAAVLSISVPAAAQSGSAEWLVLAGLALLTGSFTVKVPGVPARLSVSEVFVFAAVMLYGPGVATIIAALDTLVISARLGSGHRSVYRAVFNIASGAIAIAIAANLFFWSLGSWTVPIRSALDRLLIPLAILATSYFLLNSWFVAIALSFERGISAYALWRANFVWLGLTYLGSASVAMLLVSYTHQINFTALGVIVPLVFITYLTFRTSMGRLEDANRHVVQLNELYLSAIETLAMAVDAKDQITHGHIRRVQVYTTELAKRLGVKDERQLKAIEAAALLHDMGKLAIPEHILNKPGKLTPAEFEKMKRHAEIGADLLSAIPFPYPVVPIVRHHHENWDGTGYPNKVAGTDIPLGARILSVVDCFDALTSDRPYRPRLSKEAAFEIIRERRGTMYDPLIVDAFIAAYDSIAPEATRAGQEAKTLLHPTAASVPEKISPFEEIHAGSLEAVALLEIRRVLSAASTTKEALAAAFGVLRQFTPATVLAFYEYDGTRDTLSCSHSFGDGHALLAGLEIPNGERTSGWAAANLSAISNSVASLDLGTVAEVFTPRLRSTICSPVQHEGSLLAVLTLYSTLDAPFTDRHQILVEQIAVSLAGTLRHPRFSRTSIVAFPEHSRTPQGRRS